MNDSILKSVKENQEYHMTNVLSFRRKLTADKMQDEVSRINAFIESGGYKKTGPTVTATFSVEQVGEQQLIDMEILIPLDGKFVPPKGCVNKPRFHLVNALCIRHEGSPKLLQASYNTLNSYIANHKLRPITSAYNITVRDIDINGLTENLIIDIYIGICPNAL